MFLALGHACYDESKRVGETLCNIFHNLKGVRTNTIRPLPCLVQACKKLTIESYRISLVGLKVIFHCKFMGREIKQGLFATLQMLWRDLFVILNGVPGEAYNIGNPNPEISVIELIEKIELILDKKVKYNIVDYPDSYPADEPNRRCPDILKAKTN